MQAQLKAEKEVLKKLEAEYKAALAEINEKVKLFDYDISQLDAALQTPGLDEKAIARLESMKRSKVYQKQYQEALKGQISGIVDKLHGDTYSTISEYLNGCYTDSYLGTMYSLQQQGIPLIVPIDQAAVVKAVQLDSKISKGLYTRLGVDSARLKKVITSEITRGVASSMAYADIARNIRNASSAPLYNCYRIARTEGHRIQQASAADARDAAKERGADVLKQWDATLDGVTRDTHRMLDGQIRETDEPFEANGKKAMMPGGFGDPAEDCNCRCVALTRARWALDEDELKTLQKRAEYFGLDKTDNFKDFEKKYLKATQKITVGETQWVTKKNVQNDFTVNRTLVNTKKYHDKFDGLTSRKQANESIYQQTMKMLEHRDGTEMEDLALIDSKTGKFITQNIASVKPGSAGLTNDQYAEYLKHDGGVILIHNHPNSSRVSLTDILTMFEHEKVDATVAVGHDGSVFIVSNPNRDFDIEKFRQMVYNNYLEEYKDKNLATIKTTDDLYALGVFEFERR